MRRLMAERKRGASSAKPPPPGGKRGPTNSELRLRRLTAEELDSEPRGILELFAEREQSAEDAPLVRDDDEQNRQ
jgi:hypothetical protein